MKKVEAIIRHSKLEETKEALQKAGFKGMIVTPVLGFGRQEGYTELFRGVEREVEFTSKVKIEVILQDDLLDTFTDVLTSTARTGAIGDGKIFVTTVEDIIRIRTSERGKAALD